MNWPEWWEWDVEISSHVEKRMVTTKFNEIDLRSMLDSSSGYEKDSEEGRFLIRSVYKHKYWEIIVEPDYEEKILVIITAYSPEM
jgi:hypothetical protein